MSSLARRIMLVVWLLGTVTVTSLWYLTPDTMIRVTAIEPGQVADIVGLESYDGLTGGVVLADGRYQVPLPFEFEVPSRLISRHQVEVMGGPGAPVLVAATDKFGQTFRARGERVVVWQGPLANGGVSSSQRRTVLRNP